MDLGQVSTNENENNKEVLKTKIIKLKPSKEQDKTLRKWFGASRWVYNQCVDLYNKGKLKKMRRVP